MLRRVFKDARRFSERKAVRAACGVPRLSENWLWSSFQSSSPHHGAVRSRSAPAQRRCLCEHPVPRNAHIRFPSLFPPCGERRRGGTLVLRNLSTVLRRAGHPWQQFRVLLEFRVQLSYGLVAPSLKRRPLSPTPSPSYRRPQITASQLHPSRSGAPDGNYPMNARSLRARNGRPILQSECCWKFRGAPLRLIPVRQRTQECHNVGLVSVCQAKLADQRCFVRRDLRRRPAGHPDTGIIRAAGRRVARTNRNARSTVGC